MPHKRDKTVIFSGKGRPVGLYMCMCVRVGVINTNYKVKEESEKVGFKAQHSENKDHGIWSHHFMANRWRNSGNSVRLYFWGAPKSLQIVAAAMKLKDAYSLEGKL